MVVERKNIGIFGVINVGKSTLMNIITQQETSIVDNYPGTTTDIKQAIIEFHQIGPVKLFDTAGIDEKGALGEKKRLKTFAALKEVDLILLIIDPFNEIGYEKDIVELAKKYHKDIFIIYNIFADKKDSYEGDINLLFKNIESQLRYTGKSLDIDFSLPGKSSAVINFIENNLSSSQDKVDFFPRIKEGDIVFLNIPMDEETPQHRLLRPQAWVQEHLLRNYVSTFAYRMDLGKARKDDPYEKEKFLKTIELLHAGGNFKLLITDSQAIDIVHPWTLDEQGNSIVEITTFSVIMANVMSNGRLKRFVDGINVMENLKRGDKILIAEACNHDRIAEDIGTVQIPNKIKTKYGEGVIGVDHAFGREFQSCNLDDYKLVVHCGGCMIDKQKMNARLEELSEYDVPITNYGLILSYFQSPHAFSRVVSAAL